MLKSVNVSLSSISVFHLKYSLQLKYNFLEFFRTHFIRTNTSGWFFVATTSLRMTAAQFPSHLSAPATRDLSARLVCNNLTFSRSLPTYFQFTREISMFNQTHLQLSMFISPFSLSPSLPLSLFWARFKPVTSRWEEQKPPRCPPEKNR